MLTSVLILRQAGVVFLNSDTVSSLILGYLKDTASLPEVLQELRLAGVTKLAVPSFNWKELVTVVF